MTLPMTATGRRTKSRAAPAPEAAEPLYTISVVARLVLLTPQTIRACEGAGLVSPSRSTGRQRLYSQHEVERLRRVKTLMVDMGINMAGVEVALRLMERVAELERELANISREQSRSSQPRHVSSSF